VKTVNKFKKKNSTLVGFLLCALVASLLIIPGKVNLVSASGTGSTESLPVIGSMEKLKSLLSQMETQVRYFGMENAGQAPIPSNDKAAVDASKGLDGAAEVPSSESGAGQDFSQTNVQVQGVDEADIVKTDGKYIYQVSKGRIVISKAVPASAMKVVKVISFDQGNLRPLELYVDNAHMVVIGTASGYLYPQGAQAEPGLDIYPPPYRYEQHVQAIVYDIKDKNNIRQVRELKLSGNYVSSRKLGNALYLVANKSINSYRIVEENRVDLPFYQDSVEGSKTVEIGLDKIRYFPDCSTPNYLLVAGLDLSQPGRKADVSSYLGSGHNIYVSQSALYAAVSRYELPRPQPANTPGLLPVPRQTQVNTTIYKFNLDGGRVAFKAKGKVPGTVLNQFSMDAYNGNLRVATTTGDMWRTDEGTSKNNVYVLDGSLSVIGKVENIAPGERIYSARFVGNRAYLVTFKNIDPFFVLDMSTPRAPKVLGALKIPGYSDYLHPVDGNHVLGFGKDTVEQKWTGWDGQETSTAYYQGMKIALFDVTDVTRPVEKFKTVIGDRGTDSPLLGNHKALLFDKTKGLLAFPVTVMEVPGGKANAATYGQFVFQGAYVYSFSIDKGLSLLGKITHLSEEDLLKSGSYWYGSDKNVERVLYIGNTLYTVSNGMVKANELTTLKPTGSLLLP
jgi:inhibitor of cysteine peptidase